MLVNYLSLHKSFIPLFLHCGPLCGPVIGFMLITVPGSLRSRRLSDRSWVVCWEPRDVNECMPLMTDRCTLLVCIYVFKLPSAVHNPNGRSWNKRKKLQTFISNHYSSRQCLVHNPLLWFDVPWLKKYLLICDSQRLHVSLSLFFKGVQLQWLCALIIWVIFEPWIREPMWHWGCGCKW